MKSLALPFLSDAVLKPSISTRIIANNLGDCNGLRVLVIGSGAGLLPIRCALLGGNVTAIDIEPQAVQITLRNADAIGVHIRAEVYDFWKMPNLKNSWDIVVSNPPQQPSHNLPNNGSWFEYAHFGGRFGQEFICGLIEFSGRCLSSSGRLVCSIFDFLRDEIWTKCAAEQGLDCALQATAKKRKGLVTRRSMLLYPQYYREASLVSPYYGIRVFTFRPISRAHAAGQAEHGYTYSSIRYGGSRGSGEHWREK